MPAAHAAMIMPSISRCGFFCMSSRSLKVPGSDSSALQTRYLSIVPWGRKDAFLPIAKPAPPRPRTSDAWSSASTSSGSIFSALLEHLVAAGLLVDLERVEAGLVDVLVEELHSGISSVSADGRIARFLSGSGGRPAIRSSTIVRQSVLGERTEVLAVDRRHRRDVAGAEALEAAHVEARVGAGGVLHRLVDRVRAAQRARDVRAHVDRVLALRDGHEHVVERRDGGQVGGRHAHHARGLLDRRRRAPAVVALDRVQRRDRGGVEVGVAPHGLLDLRAQLVRHRRRRGVGDDRRVLREVGGLVPARDARAVRVALDLASGRWPSSGRCPRAPGRASRASRSGRRCRGPGPSA